MNGDTKKDYWPCACVKRDARGNLSHIKLHPPERRKCPTCGSKRPPVTK